MNSWPQKSTPGIQIISFLTRLFPTRTSPQKQPPTAVQELLVAVHRIQLCCSVFKGSKASGRKWLRNTTGGSLHLFSGSPQCQECPGAGVLPGELSARSRMSTEQLGETAWSSWAPCRRNPPRAALCHKHLGRGSSKVMEAREKTRRS